MAYPLVKRARRSLGSCYIGQHAKTGDYVLLQFKDNIMVRPIVSIPKVQMTQSGLETVLDQLRHGPGSGCVPIIFKDAATKKEMFKLKREHALVWLALLETDQLEMRMIPLHAKRGFAFDMDSDEVRTFGLPKSNVEFMGLLADALEIAT